MLSRWLSGCATYLGCDLCGGVLWWRQRSRKCGCGGVGHFVFCGKDGSKEGQINAGQIKGQPSQGRRRWRSLTACAHLINTLHIADHGLGKHGKGSPLRYIMTNRHAGHHNRAKEHAGKPRTGTPKSSLQSLCFCRPLHGGDLLILGKSRFSSEHGSTRT